MGQSANTISDQLLGKKERSEEPQGFDLLEAANALGFSRAEIKELNRLYNCPSKSSLHAFGKALDTKGE